MPVTKEAKKALVASTAKELESAKEGILVGYQGLTVEEMQELRAKLREQGLTLRVLKNTLIDRALKDAKVEGIDAKAIKKPTALVLGDDEVAPAKVVVEFAKEHKKLELITGAIDKKAVDVDQLKALASMPSRDEMVGKVVGTIAAPISGFVRVLAGTQRAFVGVLSAIQESKS